MTTARFILAIVFLLCAAYVVVMNWGCVIVSIQNRKRGIDRHHSTVAFVSLILAALAYVTYPRMDKNWIAILPLVDIANWTLLWLPVVLIREARARNKP